MQFFAGKQNNGAGQSKKISSVVPANFMESLHSWWEVPCIAYFCSLFKTAFRLFEFAIEELELGFILDGTSNDTCLIRDLIICLLRGCYQTKDVTFLNWELYLYDILQKVWVKEEDQSNPLSHSTFYTLPLRTKVEILYCLCEYRLDIVDVVDVMKAVDTRRLRVQPLGRDQKGNVYWYFYGLRLYREECLIPPENLKKKWEEEWKKECEKHFQTNNTNKIVKKRKRGRPRKVLSDSIYLESDGEEKNKSKKKGNVERQPRWTVVCNTLKDWHKLAEKFHKSKSVWERKLYKVLSGGFLDAIADLAAEKEKNASLSLLEKLNQRNESIRQELQNGGAENLSTNLSHKQKRKKREELSVGQQEGRTETRASKAKTCKAKHQEEKPDAASTDSAITKQAEKQLGSEEVEEEKLVSSFNQELHQNLLKVLSCVKNHKDSWPFLEPVDESFAPGYYSIIKDPIDLSVIEKKIQQGTYSCWKEMQSDFRKMIQNCNLYNGSHSDYAIMAQTIWRLFQKQIKRTFIDAPSNQICKKKVRFLLPVNMDEEENSDIAGRDCSTNEEDNKTITLKTDTKRKRRKKRPAGMRAIEMLAEAAEKALKEAEESNLKNCPPNKEVPLTSVSAAFPSLKVSTTQNHPAFLLAKCVDTSEKNTNEPTPKNTSSLNLTEAGCPTTHNLSQQQEHGYLIVETQDDQIIDNTVSSPSPSTSEVSDISLTSQDVTIATVEGEHSSPSNNNKSHSPLILYLSPDNNSHATKGKENITYHNYALTEPVEQNHEKVDAQNIQNLEESQTVNTMVSRVSSLTPINSTMEDISSDSEYLKEVSENCFPPESMLKPPFFTASQERTEIQQPIDANILNSTPLLEMADQAVKLINEEHVHSEVTANENPLPHNGFQPSLASQQYLHPVNQFSSNSKTPPNEILLNRSSPSFNQFLTNGQYSLDENGISTVPQQMMFAHFPPNHLMPHSNFPNTEGRNIPSTLEQITPSQQYICHPATSPYQTLSTVNNSKDQVLHPLTPSMNLVLLPTSSTQHSENKVHSNGEMLPSEQAAFQQTKLAPTTHMINTTSQNYLTPGCIFPGSNYPIFTTAEPSIGFTGRPLGIPITSSPTIKWNMMCNNYNPITAATSIQSHLHSHPAVLKQPPIILQKPYITSKKPVRNHSSKITSGKHLAESTISGPNQTSLLRSASIPTSKVTYQPVEVNKVGEDKVDLFIPSSLPFHHPSSTQANSQYVLENLEPTGAANVLGNSAQLFPYPGEITNQNINAFYPSHVIGSVRMPSLTNGHTGPIFTSCRNHQDGVPPILVPSGKQAGNVDSSKPTKLVPMHLPSMMYSSSVPSQASATS